MQAAPGPPESLAGLATAPEFSSPTPPARRRTSPAGGAGRHRTGCAVRRGGCRRGFPCRAAIGAAQGLLQLAGTAGRALAPTVEALPLMVCRVAALPWTSPSPSWRSSWAKRSCISGTKRRNTWTISSRLPPKRPTISPAPRPVRPRPLPLPARPSAAPAEMTEQAKHQALLVDRLRHMVVHARRQAASRSASEALAVMADRQPGEAPSAQILQVASRPSISGICMSISTASNARSPPAPAERPPARRRRGHRAPSLLNSSAATWRFSALSSTTSRRTPWLAGCAPPGAAAGWPGALFAVQRMQHRVGQLLGRDRLGEKIDEGRRAVVARIGQHLAAIGGDHDHHGRRQVALQLADQLRRAGPSRSGMRQSISTTS